MLALADAASVREGTLSVLSAGINQFARAEFPAPLNAVVALLIEVSPDDDILEIPIRMSLGSVPDSGSNALAQFDGGISLDEPAQETLYIPLSIPLDRIVLPSPGEFQLAVTIGDLEVVNIPMYSTQLVPDGS